MSPTPRIEYQPNRAGGRAATVQERDELWAAWLRAVLTPAGLGALAMLFSSGVAVAAWWSITMPTFLDTCRGGARIQHALAIAFISGLASVVIVAVHQWRRLLLGALLVEGVSLGVALALLAASSATYRARCEDSGAFEFGPYNPHPYLVHYQLGYLYLLWGGALAVLLAQAARVVRQRRPGA
jgi:hypothetical protein